MLDGCTVTLEARRQRRARLPEYNGERPYVHLHTKHRDLLIVRLGPSWKGSKHARAPYARTRRSDQALRDRRHSLRNRNGAPASAERARGRHRIGGGLVAFTGIDSPLSQAVGVGALAPVTDADRAITEFYESRGARRASSSRRSPTRRSAPVWLARATRRPNTKTSSRATSSTHTRVRDDRIANATDLRTVGSRFRAAFPRSREPHARRRVPCTDHRIVRRRLLARSRESGAIVATAAMDVRDECAALFAGSTMPAFRSRGWHIAMIRDRIARARDAGARFMRATARSGKRVGAQLPSLRFRHALYARVVGTQARRPMNGRRWPAPRNPDAHAFPAGNRGRAKRAVNRSEVLGPSSMQQQLLPPT